MIIRNQSIEVLKPYARNGKLHTELQIRQVAESINQFGWVQFIVVDKDNNVIIGHCRLESAKLLGLKEVLFNNPGNVGRSSNLFEGEPIENMNKKITQLIKIGVYTKVKSSFPSFSLDFPVCSFQKSS